MNHIYAHMYSLIFYTSRIYIVVLIISLWVLYCIVLCCATNQSGVMWCLTFTDSKRAASGGEWGVLSLQGTQKEAK